MGLEMKQSLKLSQQLVMTPQLQQAIKLLQLNHLELADVVAQELVENPVLEEEIERREDPEASFEAGLPEKKVEDPNAEGQREKEIDWEKYLEHYNSGPTASREVIRRDDDLPTYDQTLTRGESLQEHLIWQLHMADAPERTRAVASELIGNLDDRGLLAATLEDVRSASGYSIDELEDALDLIQTFEPTGVGGRDVRECLLLQAQSTYPKDAVLYRMLDDHWDAVLKQNYKAISKALMVSVPRVLEAMGALAKLEPNPGRGFVQEDARYITPDVHVFKVDGEWVIQLNEQGVPKLRVSDQYRRLLTSMRKDDKEFVQEKLRSAQWLIKSIYQRQRTIYKVMESILRQQKGFFDHGIAKLKPMILRDVAEDIGMHESTVSRVTSNKYVHTPHGTFSLKFFFNSGIQRKSGDDVASEMVKQRIKGIIDEENPRKPFSDSALVKLLAKENIKIARRTVAKYREMLGIASSSKRKRLF